MPAQQPQVDWSTAKPIQPQVDWGSATPVGGATVSATTGKIEAASAPSWGRQLEEDIREGGNRTLPGRVLGYMQGRGNKGYSGIESGVSKGAADFVGSPELGLAQAVKGWSELPHHPLTGFGDIAGGALKAFQIPGSFMGGPEAEGAIDLIPSRAHAIKVLDDIGEKAANVPVAMTETRPALNTFEQHVAAGGKDAEVMGKLGDRIEKAGEFALAKPKPRRIAGLLEAPERDVPLDRGISRGSTRGGLFDAEVNPEEPMEPRSGNPFAPISQYPGINPHYLSGSEHPELSGRFAPTKGVLRTRGATGRLPTDEFGRAVFDAPSMPTAVPRGEPIMFPEARRFYTNVSDVTKRPGIFKRALEDSREPRLRKSAGAVRSALHSDIRNAAGAIGRGDDYQNAIDEYAQNAKMRRLGKRAVFAAAPVAAGAMGLGKIHGFLNQVLR